METLENTVDLHGREAPCGRFPTSGGMTRCASRDWSTWAERLALGQRQGRKRLPRGVRVRDAIVQCLPTLSGGSSARGIDQAFRLFAGYVAHRFVVGEQVERREGITSRWIPAVVRNLSPYLGRAGYYLTYPEASHDWECQGGWNPESVVRGLRCRGASSLWPGG